MGATVKQQAGFQKGFSIEKFPTASMKQEDRNLARRRPRMIVESRRSGTNLSFVNFRFARVPGFGRIALVRLQCRDNVDQSTTILIQRTSRRDALALHAKLDERLGVDCPLRTPTAR
jgi:hypothetical protein